MLYPVQFRDGSVAVKRYSREGAICHYCQQICPKMETETDYLTCHHHSCHFTRLRFGGPLRWGMNSRKRERAIRYMCRYCTGQDGGLGDYKDIVSCPNTTCPLWPFRRQGAVDWSQALDAHPPREEPKPSPWDPSPIKPAPAAPEIPAPEPDEATHLQDYLETFDPIDDGLEIDVMEESLITVK